MDDEAQTLPADECDDRAETTHMPPGVTPAARAALEAIYAALRDAANGETIGKRAD